MKRVFLLSVLLTLIFAFNASPCFSPTDIFAAEVLVNKPGVSYDLAEVALADNVSFEQGVFIYRSHFDKRIAVKLEEVDESQIAELLKGLSVRIQIPTKQVMVDGAEDLAEAVDVDKDEFDFKSALKMELDWLETNGIISGVDEVDFAGIVEIAEAGLAGWNSRMVYENGKWLPYGKTSNPILVRGIDCGGFALEKLRYDETIILPGPSSVSFDSKLATKWGRIKAGI
jgi:hypothetical protein